MNTRNRFLGIRALYAARAACAAFALALAVSALGCASAAPAGSGAQTGAGQKTLPNAQAAQDALAAMDAAFEGRQDADGASSGAGAASSGGGSSQAGGAAPAQTAAGGSVVPASAVTKDGAGRPNWVDRPEDAFPKTYYAAALGLGQDRPNADASAFSSLVSFFGQSVKSSVDSIETYREKVSGGELSVEISAENREAVTLSSSLDQLIGAKIADRWYDEKQKTYYAVAVMEIPDTIRVYGELLDANTRLIDRMLDIPAPQRATFDTLAKYRAAATVADASAAFATVLALVGGPDRRSGLKTGEDLRLEAQELARGISVNVTAANDSGGRIKAAFAAALEAAGFRAGGGAGSRYAINADVSLTPVPLNNPNKFTRYVVDAPLVDSADNTVVVPFNINGREGHATQAEADARAIRAAESRIKTDYAEMLKEYLR